MDVNGKENLNNRTSHDGENINQILASASKVIVPLSPISVFAARSPWANLEDKTFDDVAHWLKEVREVDMKPVRRMTKGSRARLIRPG